MVKVFLHRKPLAPGVINLAVKILGYRT